MVGLFKGHWDKTVTVITDKDFVERDTFKDEFPQASLQICLFHVLRTFQREVTSDKLGITQPERKLALEILQKMAYSSSEVHYLDLYKQLKQTEMKSVLQYFDNNWHGLTG